MAHSKLCGSRVTVDLTMAGDTVSDYGQSVKACLLGQSSASVMGREIIGSSAEELRQVGAAMRKMLKAGGPPPEGRWSDLAVLEPVRDYKARHASTLLVFDAVEEAIAKIEASRAAAAQRFPAGGTCLRLFARTGRACRSVGGSPRLCCWPRLRCTVSPSRRCSASTAGICPPARTMRARQSRRTALGRAPGSRSPGFAAAIRGAVTASTRCPICATRVTPSRPGATDDGGFTPVTRRPIPGKSTVHNRTISYLHLYAGVRGASLCRKSP